MDTHLSSRRTQVLDRFPALAALPADDLATILKACEVRHVKSGTVMFDAHQACTGFPLLLDGHVRVSRAAANGREIVLYRIAPGQLCVLSATCLLGKQPHAATGTAEGAVTLLLMPPETFDHLILNSPAFRQFVLSTYGARLADVMTLVEEVAFRRLDVRLAQWLVLNGPVITCTHQHIAEELGSVREVISRMLRSFEHSGWIQLARNRIELTNIGALKQYDGSPSN